MKRFFQNNWLVIIVLLLAHLVQFWPFYFKGQLPFPGDMLVAFHFPWSGGGFAGFDPWTQYKALNTVDTVKQFYPWKVFAIDQLRQGNWPLWNPYSFSGQPLLANLQSGVFFPLNFVYFFVPVLWGWVGNVAGQLLVFAAGMYLFLRSQQLSRFAAVFGAVVAMNLSFISLWHWQLVITQSLLFLPVVLTLVNKYAQEKKRLYLFLIAVFIVIGLFGGHAQVSLYAIIIYFFFAAYKGLGIKNTLAPVLAAVFLGMVQILPTAQAYLLSAREGAATKDLFAPFVFHWQNIATVVAPDFFGHPSSRNYVGTDYRDMNAYFGLTALIFSLAALSLLKKSRDVRFFLFLALFGLLFASYPLVFVFDVFHIPVLSSGVPARMIFLFQFGAGILAAYGFDHWLYTKRRFLPAILMVAAALTVLWLVGGAVSRHNLILPTALFVTTSVLVLIKKYRYLLAVGIFGLLLFQYSFFFHKYNSFAPQKFVFPGHPVLTYLQKNAGVDRFFGTEHAVLNQNFSVFYKIFDFKGYDSIYPLRYGQLVASVETASIPKTIPRSDAYIKYWSDRQSERLLDLLSVKYLLDKNDTLTGDWDEEASRFVPERYRLLWQRRPWRIYERKTALPRVFLADSYEVITSDNQIIKRLYDVDFDYKHNLILEKDPGLATSVSSGSAQIVSYQPNQVTIKTNSDASKLLFLSDNYSPGWQATVDNKPVEILRANFTFRAVAIPAGSHEVIFQYDPLTFKIGGGISLASFAIFGSIFLWKRKS